jgi:Phosphomevalonate kinase
MRLIGIAGKKRAGKDTLGKFIIEETNGIRIAFADALKDEVCQILHINFDQLEKDKELYRPLLQWWGTEWRRGKFGEDYWLKRFTERVNGSNAPCIVVPDVRFRNEADLIRQLGGEVIRVVQTGQTSGDSHVSETDTDGIALKTIEAAKGDLESLRKAAKTLVKIN